MERVRREGKSEGYKLHRKKCNIDRKEKRKQRVKE